MPQIVLLAVSATAIVIASAALVYARHIRRAIQTQLNALHLDIAHLRGILIQHERNTQPNPEERTLRLIRPPDSPPIPRQRGRPR